MPAKKTRKMDTAIVVAIIGLAGTIITALIASPMFGKLFDATATPELENSSPGTVGLVFVNDFESGQASGFAFSAEEWEVLREHGNQVLEMRGPGDGNVTAVFGPNDFSDGEIIFRLNFRSYGGFILNFRSEVDVQTYTLYFAPADNELKLGYGSAENDWDLETLENGIRPFAFEEEVWYAVKLEISGGQMAVWVDENKVLSSEDARLQYGSMEFAIQDEGVVWIDDVEVWQY